MRGAVGDGWKGARKDGVETGCDWRKVVRAPENGEVVPVVVIPAKTCVGGRYPRLGNAVFGDGR